VVFLRLDGNDYRPGLWQFVRPAGDMTPHGLQVSEE
jgi:RNA ligase